MDPRPIHFQFRKPRPQNRTYQSYGLSDSVYYLGLHTKQVPDQRYTRFFKKSQTEQQRSIPKQQNNHMMRNQSLDLNNINKMYPNRLNSKDEVEKRDRIQSNLSTYGSNIMHYPNIDQQKVYEKQQKPFNIISFYPNSHPPTLRQFPKLTLQDKIINKKQFDHNIDFNNKF